MSLYERFENEAAFRDEFVKPLLNRLGFFGVSEEHGSREFGKDFVFSELHRLSNVRHYAAQVKHIDTINQGVKVDDLLSQVRQAFATSFRLTDSPRDCHVSAVYVFNSGEITQNAKDQILDELGRERYGDNVHFLAGDRLEWLDKWGTYQSDRNARRRLSGLSSQLRLNAGICRALLRWEAPEDLNDPGRAPDCRGFIWDAIESYLTEPVAETVEVERLSTVWQWAKMVDSIRFRLYTGTVRREFRKSEAASMHATIGLLMAGMDDVQEQIRRTMEQLPAIH